jgi:hypothetical protein
MEMNPSTLNLIEEIKRLEIRPDEAETLERCETVTNFIIDDVLPMFADPRLVEDIRWLQAAHREPNNQRWRNIVELTEGLFGEAGGAERVKEYHSLEQPCKEVSDEELAMIEDAETRETIARVKHIHEATLRRMFYLVEKCYYK